MNRLFGLPCAVLIVALEGASGANASNLVVNGGFESGNTGFTSAYTYTSNEEPPATYFIGSNPNLYNPFWPSTAMPFDGSNMMIVNGADVPNVNVWEESAIPVTPDTTYFFSAHLTSVFPASPAELNFSADGTLLGSTFTASTTVGLWQQFYATWFSGSNTSVDLSIVNQDTAFSGNDFALDDIDLDTTTPTGTGVGGTTGTPSVPEPASLLLLGGGLTALGLAKRRK